jgi:hypothetical protein
MADIYRYIGLAFYLIIPLGVFALCLSIIWRKLKGKSLYQSGTSFVGEYIYQQWETKGRRTAVEEILYEREVKRNDPETGEPGNPDKDEKQ